MGKNYFVITDKNDANLPEGAFLNLKGYSFDNRTVTVTHYGSPKTFRLPMSKGYISMNFPRKHLFLSFGYLFQTEG